MKHTPPLATIVELLDHKFLKVGGITMCREGDICWDGTVWSTYWTLRDMKDVQRRINKTARKAMHS